MSTDSLNFKDLPLSKRIRLVEDIWDSIAQDTAHAPYLSAEDKVELHQRYAGHIADPSSSVPWASVRAELFKSPG